ncbi:MAG: FprA family A-type flavoprotein [Chloroflexi bacterium]|nr:FprA family A-type flavoprotein [Chloroflexota bacterium]
MPLPERVVPVAPGVTWVGVEDWQRRSFDAILDLPYGTSYNAYLVAGEDKVALVDTACSGFSRQLLAKIATVVDPSKIDYVVMNHAEPDHSGCIADVLEQAPGAKLVATTKGVEMARIFAYASPDRCIAVKDGDSLDLGGKTLKFVYAPWLHWPETMFTFVPEGAVLLSCDFFGAHLAGGQVFAEEGPDYLISEAKRYYALIMMPYAKMAIAGLDKAAALRPNIIAPSHGPIYRDPARIMSAYEAWSRGPLQQKAMLAFVSMYGSTRRLCYAAERGITAEGVDALPLDLEVCNMSHFARDLVDTSAVVIGSPTMLGTLHPVAAYALTLIRELRPRSRLGAFVGSYAWGGGAATQAKLSLEAAKMALVDSVDVKGLPGEEHLEAAIALGRKLAARIKESRAGQSEIPARSGPEIPARSEMLPTLSGPGPAPQQAVTAG